MIEIREVIGRSLPLKIDGVDPIEPFFSLNGDAPHWHLGVACPWTLSGPEFEHDSETIEVEEFDRAVRRLLGHTITEIALDKSRIDPVFHLDGGLKLALHADTNVDPWVLSLPNAEFVIVGRAM